MALWVLTRKTTGFGELESVTVLADTEADARLAAIDENWSQNGVTDFARPDYSTAVQVDPDAKGIVSQSFAAGG